MGPLAGRTYDVRGAGAAARAAARVLEALGARPGAAAGPSHADDAELVVDVRPEVDPLLDWARCGGMWLTGEPTGPPLPAPGDQAARLRGVAAVAQALAARLGHPITLDGPGLIAERAAALGLRRRGITSPNGGSRLLPAADGWVAMTLARPEDVELLAAWMARDWHGDHWDAVERALTNLPAAAAVNRARLLGLPAALCEAPAATPLPFEITRRPASRPRRAPPLVIDLSSLWAGPLCTRLLAHAGARVVKVESFRRPDGARAGPKLFFDLMHARKESVALDFTTNHGRAALGALVAAADVVVESSRPRALEQLGIYAPAHPGIWVSITGYGRAAPGRDWVAFGDDAAVAGGIAALTGAPGGPPLFCADAYADPVAGLLAATAALACLVVDGSFLIDVAMSNAVAHLLIDAPRRRMPVPTGVPADAPRMPQPEGEGPALGAHTNAVLTEFAIAS